MGKLKQLHIDCTPECCIAGSPETCYMLANVNERTSVSITRIGVKNISRAYKIQVRVA